MSTGPARVGGMLGGGLELATYSRYELGTYRGAMAMRGQIAAMERTYRLGAVGGGTVAGT